MKGSEPVPHLESIVGVLVRRLVPNHIEVSIANGWQDAIKDSLDVEASAQGARECFRAALGVSCYGQAHFDGGGLTLCLTQKKIAVSPRDLGGKRIDLFGAQKSVARSHRMAFGFVDGGKVQPDFPRSRIQRQGGKVGVHGTRGVGILEVVLPIAAKKIPILRVRGFQLHGALKALASLQTNVMGGQRISDAEVREGQSYRERSDENHRALRVAGEA